MSLGHYCEARALRASHSWPHATRALPIQRARWTQGVHRARLFRAPSWDRPSPARVESQPDTHVPTSISCHSFLSRIWGGPELGAGRRHHGERHLGLDRSPDRHRVRSRGPHGRHGLYQPRGSRKTRVRGPAPPAAPGLRQRVAGRQSVRRSRFRRGRRCPAARSPGVRPSSAPGRRGAAGDL